MYTEFFEDRKYTEYYNAKALEKELGLSRESLISMAELLGSDYAVGIKGVGIVNALEIIAAFGGSKESLRVSQPKSKHRPSKNHVGRVGKFFTN